MNKGTESKVGLNILIIFSCLLSTIIYLAVINYSLQMVSASSTIENFAGLMLAMVLSGLYIYGITKLYTFITK
jgi:hypothetical protein